MLDKFVFFAELSILREDCLELSAIYAGISDLVLPVHQEIYLSIQKRINQFSMVAGQLQNLKVTYLLNRLCYCYLLRNY